MIAEKEKRLKVIQEQVKHDKAAEEARVKAKKQLKIVSKVVIGKVKTKTKVGTKKLEKILNNDDPEVSKAAIDTWTVDYLESIKAAQEAQAQEYLTHNDYFVRACRKEEIPCIRKQNAEIANNSSTDQMEEYKIVWAKMKEEHEEKLKVKSLASRLRVHTGYFAKHFEERREGHYQAAQAIQLERKADHDFKRAEQKRKIQEKRDVQVERNRAAKAAEAARSKQFKHEKAKEEKKVDPEPEPTRADAGNLGAPRLDTRVRFSQDQPPERTPIGPPKKETSGPGPARRNPDGTSIGAKPAVTGVATDNWRVAGKDGKTRRGRPKFTNSKKKEEPVKKEETPASSPTASSGSSTPKSLRPLRPERPKNLQPMRQPPASQPLRPQRPLRPTRSPTENSGRQNLRPTRSPTENSGRQNLRPTRSPTENSGRQNLRPTRSPTENSAPQNLRPTRPANPSLRPENPASNPTPGFRARTSANERQRTGIVPSQKKGGWRERQQMREVGIVDPVATIKQRDSPRKSPRAATGFNRDSSSVRPNRTQNSGTVRPIRPQAPGAKPGLRPQAPGPTVARPQARAVRPPASETRSVRPNSMRPPSRPPSGNLQPTPIQTQRQPEKQNNDASPEFQTVTRRRRKRFTNSRKS